MHNKNQLVEPNGATTVWYGQRTLNIAGKIRYAGIVTRAYKKINTFYKKAIHDKECYYGPFKGEFGHFLLHNLPFLTHLHQQGVRIHYCGMALHKAFLVDENGNSLLASFQELRDFFAETPSHSNETIPPEDVQIEIDAFLNKAEKSGKAFLNIGDKDLYWFVFRNWQLKLGRQAVYNLQKVYQNKHENACVIFPRKKGNASFTPNNGGPWDYLQVARIVSPYFDKVYITGHPSMSAEIEPETNIELKLSGDNQIILENCANANLIITQHSGALHIGTYTNARVLLIFNGDPPIKGLIDTLRFRKNLTQQPLHYAFNLSEVEEFVKNLPKNKK